MASQAPSPHRPPGAARGRLRNRLALLCLAPGLLWQAPAAAFFCFSFGGGSRHRDPGPPPLMLMPPPGFPYPQPAFAPPPVTPVPASDPASLKPELVEWPTAPNGALAKTVYRFRPLAPKQLPPIAPAAPVEQSQPF